MRLMVDALVAMMLAGMLAGVVISKHHDSSLEEQVDFVRREVRRFHREIMLQKALSTSGGLEEVEYPQTVDPAWFGDDLPANPLLPPSHPWLEVAPPSRRSLQHPPDRATNDPKVPRFWYNPKLGIVRARVPLEMSDDESLALYNAVNGTRLTRLFEDG